MHLQHLWLRDFRSYAQLDLELDPGRVVVVGPNGVGKTNLLEAIGYLALLESLRGAPAEAMVGVGAAAAVVRGDVVDAGREQLIEAEITPGGRNRVQVNRQRLGRSRDLLGALRVSVFAPDDLVLVKGGPSGRRTFLDRTLVALDPRDDALRAEFERCLRQRNALLKQVRGRLDDAASTTLDVWDQKLSQSGEELARRRTELVTRLQPAVATAYAELAERDDRVGLTYRAPWQEEGLAQELRRVRDDELRRAVTLVGPHRDELEIRLGGLPSRTHSSQGEQRSLALALRLAAHRLVRELTGSTPVLLLDDVFSELDPARAAALLRSLPEGQTVLSTATGVPSGVDAEQVLRVEPGGVTVDR